METAPPALPSSSWGSLQIIGSAFSEAQLHFSKK
jgi:hypothetical protein